MCLKHKIWRKSDNFKSICSTFPGPLGPSLPSEESVFLNASRWYVLITTQTILLIDCEKVILENISNFVKIRQIKNVMKVAIGPLSPGPTGPVRVNSPQTSETLWGHKSGSTFDLVMVCCLTTSSHYMNQCWLVISELLWRYPGGNLHENHKMHILDMSLNIPYLSLQQHLSGHNGSNPVILYIPVL